MTKKYIKLLVALIATVLNISVFANSNHYLIFIDAGSSGSRLHVFQYENSSSFPILKGVFSENTTPGLSSYADHPELAGNSLKKLLDDATQFLIKNGVELRSTQVNVLATAGMRLLPEDKQQAIYNNIANFIKNNYEFSIHNIMTISGKMEGLYGWLDINYLLENFQNHRPTVGSIDMGGASTQITFATDDQNKMDDEILITLNQQQYKIFSKSFIGLGENQARLTMMKDPAAANCFPQEYAFSDTGVGRFDISSCGAIYADIIQKHHVTKELISTHGQPFIAYSGIYLTYKFFTSDKTPDQFYLESKIKGVCNESWPQLQKDYPEVPDKYLATYCADGVYQSQLIYGAYKLAGHQLTIANQINQKDIDWTLGAALYSLII